MSDDVTVVAIKQRSRKQGGEGGEREGGGGGGGLTVKVNAWVGNKCLHTSLKLYIAQ